MWVGGWICKILVAIVLSRLHGGTRIIYIVSQICCILTVTTHQLQVKFWARVFVPLAQEVPCGLPSAGVMPGLPEIWGAADHGWLWQHFPPLGNIFPVVLETSLGSGAQAVGVSPGCARPVSPFALMSVGGAVLRVAGERTMTMRRRRSSQSLAPVALSAWHSPLTAAVHAWFTLFLPKHKPQTTANEFCSYRAILLFLY